MAIRNKVTMSTNIILMVLILLGALAVVNFVGFGHFFRLDLTENKEYTMSDATRGIVEDLKDLVNVKVFFSRRLPPRMVNMENQIRDLLDEMVAYSKGKIKVEFIDPGDDPELQQLAQSFTIPQIQLNVFEKDKAEVTNAYMGIGFMYADKKEAIPIIQDLGNLEYNIASKLLKVTATELKTVGFLIGHEGNDIYDDADYGAIRQELDNEYRTTMVDLTKGGDIPPEVSTLVVAGPKTILKEREKFLIDQFIMEGKKTIFLLDPIKMNPGLRGVPQPTNLDDMLAHYGVRVTRDLVIDSSNSMASFSRGYVRYSVPYPYWPRIIKPHFNTGNPVVSKLDSLTLPWCSPLRLLTEEIEEIEIPGETSGQDSSAADGSGDGSADDADAAGADQGLEFDEEPDMEENDPLVPKEPVTGVKGIVIASSTQFGAVMKSPFDLNPQQQFNPEDTGYRPLVVVLSGRFSSFYQDRAVPRPLTASGEPEGESLDMALDAEGAAAAEPEETILEQSPETQILVVGNAEFAKTNFLQQFPGNGIFLLNCIDWLTMGGDLISIRSRAVLDRPLKETSDKSKTAIRFINIFGVPIMVILLGLVWFYIRRSRSSAYAASGGTTSSGTTN